MYAEVKYGLERNGKLVGPLETRTIDNVDPTQPLKFDPPISVPAGHRLYLKVEYHDDYDPSDVAANFTISSDGPGLELSGIFDNDLPLDFVHLDDGEGKCFVCGQDLDDHHPSLHEVAAMAEDAAQHTTSGGDDGGE